MIGPTGRSARRAPISWAWENSSSSKNTVSGGISTRVRRPGLEQLAHLAAEVHHLDREPRHAHVEERRARPRRQRLRQQLLPDPGRPDQQQPRGGAVPQCSYTSGFVIAQA